MSLRTHVFNEIGVDRLFGNLGTDHAPIIEELANRKRRGEPVPRTIRCADENTAAHMAAGYAMMTGRGQEINMTTARALGLDVLRGFSPSPTRSSNEGRAGAHTLRRT